MKKILENSHSGVGHLHKVRVFDSSDFDTNLDFIDYVEIPEGVTIGIHKHTENEEIYFIFEGNGIMTVENKEVGVKKGDIMVNPVFGTHGLRNNTSAILKVLIFQVSL